MSFHSDGSYLTGKGAGTWKTADEKTLELRAGSAIFKIEFNEDGTEGVLVEPPRVPQSKLALEKKAAKPVEASEDGG